MATGLELIGSPAKGRPTLGERVPVQMFRALRLVGVMEGMDKAIGDASALIYASGQGLGEAMGKQILEKSGKDLHRFVEGTINTMRELGVGILSVTKADLENHLIVLQVNECITCAGIPAVDKTVCDFEAGVVSGILGAFLETSVTVVESKCWGAGDQYCEFEATY